MFLASSVHLEHEILNRDYLVLHCIKYSFSLLVLELHFCHSGVKVVLHAHNSVPSLVDIALQLIRLILEHVALRLQLLVDQFQRACQISVRNLEILNLVSLFCQSLIDGRYLVLEIFHARLQVQQRVLCEELEGL